MPTNKRIGTDTTSLTTLPSDAVIPVIQADGTDSHILGANLPKTDGTAPFTATVTGDGTTLEHPVTHNLGTYDVVCWGFSGSGTGREGFLLRYTPVDLNSGTVRIDGSTGTDGALANGATFDLHVAMAGAATGVRGSLYPYVKTAAGAVSPAMQAAFNAGFLQVGDAVATFGYWEGSSQGGGTYEVVATGTGTNDGGSFIDFVGFQLRAVFTDRVDISRFGAQADSTDMAAELTAAIAAAAALELWEVHIGPGTWGLASEIQVPEGVRISGAGAPRALNDKGTVILGLAAAARLNFIGPTDGTTSPTPGAKRFLFDGDDVADNPIRLGACGQGVFSQIKVSGAVVCSMVLDDTQNCEFHQIYLEKSLGDHLVLLNGAGGNKFDLLNTSRAAGWGVVFKVSGTPMLYGVPTHNSFNHAIIERATDGTTTGMVLHTAGRNNTFNDSVIACTFAGAEDIKPIIRIEEPDPANRSSLLTFNNCRITASSVASGETTDNITALVTDDDVTVVFSGMTTFVNQTTIFHRDGGAPDVRLENPRFIGAADYSDQSDWTDFVSIRGVPPVIRSFTGDGSTTAFTITHNLGYTTIPSVVVMDNVNSLLDGGFTVDTITTTSLRLVFASAPATGSHTVKVTP